MEQPSFLSRFVDPVLGFLKTFPSTIRDGFTEVADAISPARKRRRPSDSSPYQTFQPHTSPLPRASPEKSFHPQPKRLRLSDASASNAAGPPVTTPAAFRPADDLLAATTSSMHPNPQIVMRDNYPINEDHFTDLNPSFSTSVPPITSDLDIQSFFQYPLPDRRSSLTALRGIWPSDCPASESRRRSSISSNPQFSTAQLYWQRVEERHRAQPHIILSPHRKAPPGASSTKYDHSLTRRSVHQFDVPELGSVPQLRYSHAYSTVRMSLPRSAKSTPARTRMNPRTKMKRKRFYSEQRMRRSHQASLKKLRAAVTSLQGPYLTSEPEQSDQRSGTVGMRTEKSNIPRPFVEILEKDSILGQKLMKLHGAAMTRLVKSQNRSRYRQLECWLAEQDLKQFQRKREEARRLNAIESKVWKHAEDPSQHPPNDEEFVDVDYWDEEDPEWEEEMDEVAMAEREKQITVPEESSVFAALSASAVRRLRVTFNDASNYYEALAMIEGCVIRGEDLRRLKPNCWLNDEIVNAYMALLTSRTERLRHLRAEVSSLKASLVPNVKIMNSFFYSKLVQFNKAQGRYEYNYSRVRRWTRRFDAFSFDIMLIPINQQNLHWTLGFIDFRNCRVEHLDSMGTGGSQSVREFLMRWVQDEAEDKQKRIDPSKWKTHESRVPIQENTDDCGVFLCKYADFICRGWKKFTFSQRHMNYFRARIAHELLMGRA